MRQIAAFRIERDLREMAKARWTQRQMATALGVAQSTVYGALTMFQIPHIKSWSRRQYATLPIVTAIRNERMDQRLSLVQLGKIAGYHESCIGKWERGEVVMPPEAQYNLAQALGCKIVLKKAI